MFFSKKIKDNQNWVSLEDKNQLEDLLELSKKAPVLFFKHTKVIVLLASIFIQMLKTCWQTRYESQRISLSGNKINKNKLGLSYAKLRIVKLGLKICLKFISSK